MADGNNYETPQGEPTGENTDEQQMSFLENANLVVNSLSEMARQVESGAPDIGDPDLAMTAIQEALASISVLLPKEEEAVVPGEAEAGAAMPTM